MHSNTAVKATLVAEQGLSFRERELGHQYLQQTYNGFAGALQGVSGAQWMFVPGPEQWSIAQIAEHVLVVLELVSGPMWESLAQAPPPPPGRDNALIDSIIINQFPNRLTKVQAPFPLQPCRFNSAPEAIERLTKVYAKLAEFLDSTPGLREHATESRPLKVLTSGAHELMDGYQWILAAAGHTERHTKQVLEVKANQNFPPTERD